MINTGQIEVSKVIVHDVPQPGEASGPILSETESRLTDTLCSYFKTKIRRSLEAAAYPVVFAPGTSSPIPTLVYNHLNEDDSNVVVLSQEAARHLYTIQTRVNPAGLLAAVTGTAGAVPYLAILKLEKERGVRLDQEVRNGKVTFVLDYLPNLMLGENTKLFKMGLFYPDRSSDDGVSGVVCDLQRGRTPEEVVARFWLDQYLGCRRRENPDVTTERFFRTAERFINDVVVDPEKKARYDMALLTEMRSHRLEFSPNDFIKDHLEGDDRRAMREFLSEEQVATRPFLKDTSRIATALRRTQIDFEGGASVLVPPDAIGVTVSVTRGGGNKARVEIEDTVRDVHGKK